MADEVKIHGIYKHYKGDYYIVEEIAHHSETGEKLVVYRGLYENSPVWCRPYNMFLEELDPEKYPNVKQKHRFELQNIKSQHSKTDKAKLE